MDSKLIVKILPTKKDGNRTIGTGYPIANDLVLTARHVVIFPDCDTDKPILLEWPDLKRQDAPNGCCSAEVTEIVFDGGDECDVAILKCRIPAQVTVSSFPLAKFSPKAHEQWESFGYAKIGKDEKANTREKISLLGKFHPPDRSSHKINLTSESDALEKSGWRGVSGAPVFQGPILYAVISETPQNRDECFTAISIPYLLEHNQNFCQVLAQPIDEAIKKQHRKFQEEIKKQIARILNNGNVSVRDLANELLSITNATADEIATSLVEDNSTIDAIAGLSNVFEKQTALIHGDQWDQCRYDVEQIGGWILINSVEPNWWFNNEQKFKPDTNKETITQYFLDEPEYIEVLISRGSIRSAEYALNSKGKIESKVWHVSVFDCISDEAIDTQLLEPIYKDLHRRATQLPSCVDELVESIISRAETKFNKQKKLIYYLVTKEYLDSVKLRPWFTKIQSDLAGKFQFICCFKKEQHDSDTPCIENQKQVLEQFAELLDIKK